MSQIPHVSSFLRELEAEHTQRAYRTDLKRFFSHVADDPSEFDVENVDSGKIQDFLRTMRADNLSYATRRRRLSAIRAFYDWLQEENLVSRHPARTMDIQLRNTDDSADTPRFLEKNELEGLISAAGKSPTSGIRDQGLILVILYAALRRGEAAALNIEHVRPLGRHWVVDVPSPSGSQGGFVKIPEFVATAVQRVATQYEEDTGPLWRSFSNRNRGARLGPDAIYKRVREIGKTANLGAIDIETLRRSGLRLASASGARPAQVQSHARLQDPASAVRYFDSTSEDARLQDAAADHINLNLDLEP